MADKRAGQEFDAYRASYSDAVDKAISVPGLDVDFFTRAKASRLLDWLSANVGPAEELSVLDVGCGVGNYHPLVSGRLAQLTGVDPSVECLDEAKARNSLVAYKASDGLTLPFEDNVFDAAFAICVMHHVPPEQWALFVAEMARVVRKGGAVLVFEHNPLNPLTQRIVSRCPFDEDATLLRKKRVTAYFDEAGLSDISGHYILTVPSVEGPLRWIDDRLSSLPTGAQYFVSGIKA
ncbi:methyltransferase domain-containing protein [Mesorhizobium sp. NBSH29]|uniref:class I SAM-dependent methyltransferase n=1 Tax=Mesorhizobium sp. NBSH29 TaxID=2654249 RepID=UPI001896A4F2|nr:class I SAM-dependent methyltransferase [Mesorhizobium sp. NBSH29]QPC87433.1 methyltransferase domain-containing protein [Mesorhizobium sp. NBSH29]